MSSSELQCHKVANNYAQWLYKQFNQLVLPMESQYSERQSYNKFGFQKTAKNQRIRTAKENEYERQTLKQHDVHTRNIPIKSCGKKKKKKKKKDSFMEIDDFGED